MVNFQFVQSKIKISFFFAEARASDDGSHVEYRFKDYDKIYALFEARFLLHLNCYRMSSNVVCDQILREIVHNHINEKIEKLKLEEINADNMSAFLQLTDDKILEMIEANETSKMMLNISNIKRISTNNSVENGVISHTYLY